MKTIKKEDFSTKHLGELKPKDYILVVCHSCKEVQVTQQMCCNMVRRYPREDVARYATNADLENFYCLIQAIPRNENK